ncbi:ATP-binding cassette domain-containing protein [Kaarinaea lacus]
MRAKPMLYTVNPFIRDQKFFIMLLAKLTNACLAYGVHHLLDNVDFQINDNERICIIGRNGTGKTSLLNVIAGQAAIDSGEVWYRAGLRVAYLTQEITEHPQMDAYSVVSSGLPKAGELLAEYHKVSHQVATAEGSNEAYLKKLSQLQQQLEHHDGWSLDQKISTVCSQLELPVDELFADLSGGTQRRVLLAKALVSDPDLLLLDEPTNHLDIERIQWLEEFLINFRGTLIFVTHDRLFLQHLASRIVELDRGILTSYPGNYEKYEVAKQKALEEEQIQNAKFDKKLAEEESWIRQGIKARRTRNEGRVRALKALRKERSQRREITGNVKMNLESSQASGKLVAVLDDVCFSYPDGQPVIQHFSTRIMRGDRIGIVGPNGCGKSTLIKLLMDQLKPQSGSIDLGTNLQPLYFDQQREQLDPDKSVIDNLGLGTDYVTTNGKSKHVIGYLQDFLFLPQRAQSPVRALSGGEKNRLLLARLFTRPANLLILDEPTNDLDVESLELLEELVSEFSGTIILVSHDRAFLDNIVTGVWVFEGDGVIEEYVGGYSDWYTQHQRKLADAGKGSGKKITAAPKAEASKHSASIATPQPIKKLSYKEQRELEQLPGMIESLEKEKQQLENQMGQSDFYQQEQQHIKSSLQRLDELNAQLENAYHRWEQLENRT